MARLWQQLIHLLQLTRVALMFAAISNGWLVVFLSPDLSLTAHFHDAMQRWSLKGMLLLVAVVAAGLHVFGAALNDVLDARRDRLFSPDRPIAAGRMARTPGVVLGIVSLIAAIAAAILLGEESAMLTLFVAVTILFYDTAGKHLPSVGIVSLAMMRALFMFIPNPTLGFAWPIWVMFTHVIVWTAVAYRLQNKRPHLFGLEWWGLVVGWMFWTMALVGWMAWHDTLIWDGRPGLWIGPAIAAAGFGVYAWWTVARRKRRAASDREAGKALFIRSILWLIVYDAGWLLAAGLLWEGMLHLGLFAVAWCFMRGVTWLAHSMEKPAGYSIGSDGVR